MKSFKIALIAAAVTLFPGAAQAATAVSASGSGVSATLTVRPLLSDKLFVHALAAVPVAAGTAPASFDRTGTVAKVDEKLSLVATNALTVDQSFKTGLVTAAASSSWPTTLAGAASARIANASMVLDSGLDVLGLIKTTVGFSLATGELSSATTIGTDAKGALFATHSSSIAGLTLSGDLAGLVTIQALAKAAATPNAVVDLGAVKLFLNEQVESRTGTSGLSAYTNALRVNFNDYLLNGQLVSGNVTLGRSEVNVSGVAPVPEPATWATMILGAGLVGATLRRRRPAAIAAA